MSGTGFHAAIRIVLRPSRRLRQVLIALHAGIAALAWCGLPAPPAAALVALASAAHCAQWLAALARAGAGIEAVLLDSAGRWWVQYPGGRRVAACVTARALVLPFILVLPLRVAPGRQVLPLVLLADNVPPDDLRRLRVRLLWQSRAVSS